jgi:hypothetical protein
MSTMNTDIWAWSGTTSEATPAIDGYAVEAADGSIGKVDETTYEVGSSYIVVDTGPWIFGKKVLLPAGVVERIDSADEKVYVTLAKDQIKDSPEFDEKTYNDAAYRNSVGDYYSPMVRR